MAKQTEEVWEEEVPVRIVPFPEVLICIYSFLNNS